MKFAREVANFGFVPRHGPHWSEVTVDSLGAGDRVEHRDGAVNLGVAEDYPSHLRDVLDTHEQSEPLRHIRRTLVVQGDLRDTLPPYLDQNPHTVIALAYFDLDLYEPTRDTLNAIQPYLTQGNVLAFHELDHAKWPGETAAFRDVLSAGRANARIVPGRAAPAYLRWGTS